MTGPISPGSSPGGVTDTGRRDRQGNPVWELTWHALEGLDGFHREGGSLRARCPAHGGGNRGALRISPDKGVGTCAVCGATFVVTDHPAQRARQDAWERSRDPIVTIGGQSHRLRRAVVAPEPRNAPHMTPTPQNPSYPAQDTLQRLQGALALYAARLPGSDGERYLAARGIPLDVARHLGWGWGGDRGDPIGLPVVSRETGEPQDRDYFRRRVVIPLAAPDGQPVGAFGRTVEPDREPRYLALDAARGMKALTNGGAVAAAITDGAPLVIVEGALDAAAIIAGGLASVVAIGSTRYPWPRHFRGVRHAVILPDNDGDAGREGAIRTQQALELEGVAVTILDPAILGEHKDAAAYWQARHALPGALIAASTAPVVASRWSGFADRRGRLAHAPEPTATSPGPDQPGDPLTPDDRAALDVLDDLATDYRDDDPDAGTVLPTDHAGHALERLVRQSGADRLPLTDAMLAEARRTAREIVSDPDDPFYTASDFAAEMAASWAGLTPADRATGWAAWQLAARQEPWSTAQVDPAHHVGTTWAGSGPADVETGEPKRMAR